MYFNTTSTSTATIIEIGIEVMILIIVKSALKEGAFSAIVRVTLHLEDLFVSATG